MSDQLRWGFPGRRVLLVLAGIGAAVIPAAMATFPAPVNGPIVFFNCDDGNGQIYRINPDGSGRKKLTTDVDGVDTPSISPDGQRIAFGSDLDADPPQVQGDGGIYIMSINGGTPVLVPGTLGLTRSDPAWTPDGESLVFGCDLSVSPGDEGICKIPVSGGTPTLIAGTLDGDDVPDVSPDGGTVAFLRNSAGDNIFTIPLVGGVATQITNCPAPPDACDYPSFAPDGNSIALQFGDSFMGTSCIAVADITGSLPVSPSCLSNSSPFEDEFPAFSPDGLVIAIDAGDGHLAILGADGNGRELIDTGVAHSCAPSWGRFVDKKPAEAFCGKAYFDARSKATGRKATLAVKFVKAGCDADALVGLEPSLEKFNEAMDRIATAGNDAIDKRGGVAECDPELQALLAAGMNPGIERIDLLEGAASGEDYLTSVVMQTCDDFVAS